MNNKASKIINTLLLSALLSISGKDEQDTNEYLYYVEPDSNTTIISPKSKIIKNVFKLGKNGKVKLIVGHRSHSSHRSHYSSRSRCSTIHSPLKYVLGDRELKEGMYGSDVDMLVAVLKSQGIILDNIKLIQGMACYDSIIIKEIKAIQESKGMFPNGVCDEKLLSLIL